MDDSQDGNVYISVIASINIWLRFGYETVAVIYENNKSTI